MREELLACRLEVAEPRPAVASPVPAGEPMAAPDDESPADSVDPGPRDARPATHRRPNRWPLILSIAGPLAIAAAINLYVHWGTRDARALAQQVRVRPQEAEDAYRARPRPKMVLHELGVLAVPDRGSGDGILAIEGHPRSKTYVFVDGENLGYAPLELRVARGTYTIRASSGYGTETAQVEVPAGERVTWRAGRKP